MVGRTTRKTTKGTRAKSSAKRLKEQTINSNAPDIANKQHLFKEYESFAQTLGAQILRTAGLKKEELQQLFRQEEEFFHRQCNQFTSAQLDMTSAEMENFLKIQEEKEPLDLPDHQTSDQLPLASDPPVAVIKIPLRHRKRKSGPKMHYRRPSITTPHLAVNRPVPKFMTTGVKNTKPRPGRLGEILYSENGSPVVVIPDSKKLKLALRKEETSPVADEV